LARKENSAFLEAYGSEDKNSFAVRKAVRRRKLRCMLKKILQVLTELLKLKRKNWPTKQSARFLSSLRKLADPNKRPCKKKKNP